MDQDRCPACGIAEDDLPVGHELAMPLNGDAPTCAILPPPEPDIIQAWLSPGRSTTRRPGETWSQAMNRLTEDF